jgi:hypothetical protein
MEQVMNLLRAAPENDVVMPNSFENRKQDGELFGVFPLGGPSPKIIYFPKGTYLVSDTICYSFDNLQNGLGAELNWCIRFQGESQQECIIKLKDGSKGFERGMARPMISYVRGHFSNIAMSNFMRDLTIDIGAGNPSEWSSWETTARECGRSRFARAIRRARARRAFPCLARAFQVVFSTT